MCGIAGYYSPRSYDPSVLEAMVESLFHRGPDSSGYYTSGPFNVGMRRLSINGLTTGDQPFFSNDEDFVMLYNGEIYNAPELREELERKGFRFKTTCDGEVVVHLFSEIGPRAFERLDGMYAICIWSIRDQKLYLARDIPGEKPLYYTRTKNNDLVFGSEIQALACHPGVETSLNIQSLWDFPTFLWIPEPNTIYNGISVLPRAHYLEFDGTKLSLHAFENKFNEFQYSPSDSWSDLVEKTRAVVSQAVYSRLLSDVPVGAFLSSGLDSSIVCTLARQRLTDLTTFSIGFMPDAVDPYEGHADESAEAEAYARHLGTKHHVIRVRGADFKQDLSLFCQRAGQPYAVSSGLGVMAVAREARKRGIKVLLSGDGADELFGGYSWYKWFSHSAMNLPDISDNPSVSMHSMGLSAEQIISCIAAYAPAKRAWAWHYYASEQEKADLFTQDISNNALSSVRIFESYKPTGAWEVMDYIRQDRACYLPNEMMVKLDRMTMAHSVEGRAPLVAPSILNFVKNLNYEHMVKGDVLKPLLRAAFDDLLPASITRRAKHGFRVPIDTWLKGEWNDLFEEAFSSASALHRLGILSKDAREKAVRMLHDPMRVNGHSLFCFIILNLWLEQNKAISRL